MRMSDYREFDAPALRARSTPRRVYWIVLTISLVLNVLLGGMLYLYSTVESFMSVISMAVGIFG